MQRKEGGFHQDYVNTYRNLPKKSKLSLRFLNKFLPTKKVCERKAYICERKMKLKFFKSDKRVLLSRRGLQLGIYGDLFIICNYFHEILLQKN